MDQLRKQLASLFLSYNEKEISAESFKASVPAGVEAYVNTEEEQQKLEMFVNEDQIIFTADLTNEQAQELEAAGFDVV